MHTLLFLILYLRPRTIGIAKKSKFQNCVVARFEPNRTDTYSDRY